MLKTNYNRNDVEKYLQNTLYSSRLATVALLHLDSQNQSQIAKKIGIVQQGVKKIILQCQELILWHQRLDQFSLLDKNIVIGKKITDVFPSHWEATKVLSNANYQDLSRLVETPYGNLVKYRNIGPGSIIRLNSVLSFLGCRTIEPDDKTLASESKKFVSAYFCTVFKQSLQTSKALAEIYEENKWCLVFARSLGERKLYPSPCFFFKNSE